MQSTILLINSSYLTLLKTHSEITTVYDFCKFWQKKNDCRQGRSGIFDPFFVQLTKEWQFIDSTFNYI
jgi:hypothetical protein